MTVFFTKLTFSYLRNATVTTMQEHGKIWEFKWVGQRNWIPVQYARRKL